jgi:hypothetical protein
MENSASQEICIRLRQKMAIQRLGKMLRRCRETEQLDETHFHLLPYMEVYINKDTNKPIGMWRGNQPVRTSKGKEEAGGEEE